MNDPVFYDSIEEYHMSETKRGRPLKYVTLEKFNEFLNNHFFHLKVEVRVNTVINGITLAALVSLIIIMALS